jgi:hypothetical protein
MARLTEQEVILRAQTEDIWKVHVHVSELGWGNDSWDAFYDSFEEASQYYTEINKNLPTDHVPDYYMVASAPKKVTLKIA